MNTTKLQSLRAEVTDIDEALVALLNKRAAIALEIGKVKGESPVYDPERESEVLEHIVEVSQGPLPKGSLEDIYATIITACREIQLK